MKPFIQLNLSQQEFRFLIKIIEYSIEKQDNFWEISKLMSFRQFLVDNSKLVESEEDESDL